MLNRQKTLISLIDLAGGRVERLQLVKWSFLLRVETESRGGDSFYDFVPYHYGPYSFSLYQEIDKLIVMGYLEEAGTSSWCLGRVKPPKLTDRYVFRDLAATVQRCQKTPIQTLIDYVYKTYPHFTVNSKKERLAERFVAPRAVYTAGYEGKSIDAFLNGLTQAGIAHLIDVRMNPIARRYGFHRSTLARLCDRLGIRYTHVPSLGISSQMRRDLHSKADYDSLFENYEATTLKNEQSTIHTLSDWFHESSSVLVCMEAEPNCCHRARLAKPVSGLTKLPIIHLK